MQHTAPLETSERQDPTPPVQQALLPWLGLLQQLYPPNGVLLVGAGGGTSPWVQHLMASGHRNVTLIEADETTAARLKLVAQAQPSWKVLAGLVGPESTHTLSYTASLQPESGLLEPESLHSLWPNLKTTQKQTRQTITLAELQQDAEPPANWLLVDCLPALPILQGAAQQLAEIDVIALRVLLDNTNNGDATTPTFNELDQIASANSLRSALHALGFRCLTIETSRHPAIGHALFVRDTAALAQKQQQQLAQQAQTAAKALATTSAATAATAAATKQAEERAAQVQQLIQAKAAADKLATERQQQLDQLQAQLKQATEQAQASSQEAKIAKAAATTAISAATAATAAAVKQAEERAAQVQQLTQAKAAADKLATERQQQLDQLRAQLKQATEQAQASTQEAEITKAAATTAISAATAANKQAEERAAQVQQLTLAKAAADELLGERMAQIQAHEQRLQQLQAHSTEADLLKNLLQAELTKAETQITLIKDLLLLEKGL